MCFSRDKKGKQKNGKTKKNNKKYYVKNIMFNLTKLIGD